MNNVSDYVKSVLHNCGTSYPNLIPVNVFHKDGLCNTLERRVAYFEEYAEAELWAKRMKEDYLDFGLPFVVYIGGYHFYDFHVEQLVKCSVN